MTTYHCNNGVFYADTRAYVNGQPFNISGKIVPLDDPIVMKATLNKGSVKPIVLNEAIYGYFILHAAEPARALFRTMLESAKTLDGDVQNVLDNHAQFIEVFKLGAYDTHFTLYLIAETGIYTISTPMGVNQECSYIYMPYVNEEYGTVNEISLGANNEWFTAHISAGVDPIIAYYCLFLQYHESGGNIETWKIRTHKGKKMLVRHEFYEEASEDTMRKTINAWREKGQAAVPVSDLTSIFTWGPPLLSLRLLEDYMTSTGITITENERHVLTHLTLPSGKVIDLQEVRRTVIAAKKKSA